MPEFQFDGLGDFLAMGGDAFFVWTAYLLFAISITWNLVQPRFERRRVLNLLKARQQREAGRGALHDERAEATERT